MNTDFTKCFSCNNRNSYGYCNLTVCNYSPIQSTYANEIKQENLIIPCPISNEIKTFEEVKKEWEEKGFEVENNDKSISFRNTKLNTDIYIDKMSKDIQICVCHYNYAQTISFDLHNLLTKTIRTLEV